jgi:hypothetical protein
MPPEGCKKPSYKIPHLHPFHISTRARLIFDTRCRILGSHLTHLRHLMLGASSI